MSGPSLGAEDSSTTSAAAFFDANGDGWPDLYIAKGGYSLWEPNTPVLQDQLWLNDGKGGLYKADGALPDVSASAKSCVRPCDFDGDGDIDLFVGGRVAASVKEAVCKGTVWGLRKEAAKPGWYRWLKGGKRAQRLAAEEVPVR